VVFWSHGRERDKNYVKSILKHTWIFRIGVSDKFNGIFERSKESQHSPGVTSSPKVNRFSTTNSVCVRHILQQDISAKRTTPSENKIHSSNKKIKRQSYFKNFASPLQFFGKLPPALGTDKWLDFYNHHQFTVHKKVYVILSILNDSWLFQIIPFSLNLQYVAPFAFSRCRRVECHATGATPTGGLVGQIIGLTGKKKKKKRN